VGARARTFRRAVSDLLIIALGETIVATGTVASQLDFTTERVLAIAVAFLGTAVYWWLYFDEVAERSHARLAEAGPKIGGSVDDRR
jgi:low temperature requirement protein LtrA